MPGSSRKRSRIGVQCRSQRGPRAAIRRVVTDGWRRRRRRRPIRKSWMVRGDALDARAARASNTAASVVAKHAASASSPSTAWTSSAASCSMCYRAARAHPPLRAAGPGGQGRAAGDLARAAGDASAQPASGRRRARLHAARGGDRHPALPTLPGRPLALRAKPAGRSHRAGGDRSRLPRAAVSAMLAGTSTGTTPRATRRGARDTPRPQSACPRPALKLEPLWRL